MQAVFHPHRLLLADSFRGHDVDTEAVTDCQNVVESFNHYVATALDLNLTLVGTHFDKGFDIIELYLHIVQVMATIRLKCAEENRACKSKGLDFTCAVKTRTRLHIALAFFDIYFKDSQFLTLTDC